MSKVYNVRVRGGVPKDLSEQLSAAHAAAILVTQREVSRPKNDPSPASQGSEGATDEQKDEAD